MCVFLVRFPVHWAVALLQSTWGYPGDAEPNEVSILALIPSEALEYFGMSFCAPFVMIAVGASIAPKFKFQTGIALAVVVGGFYGVTATRIAAEILDGLYTPGRWIQLAIAVPICVAGVACGLYRAHMLALRERASFPGGPS